MTQASPSRPAPADADFVRRELYFFNLYRTLEAALLCLLAFAPLAGVVQPARAPLLAQGVAVAYLLVALALLGFSRRWHIHPQVLVGIAIDLLALGLSMHAQPGWWSALAMMLLFNVASAAVLLPLRSALLVGCAAVALLVAETVWTLLSDGIVRSPAELTMFAVSYLAGAMLANTLGRKLRTTQALAQVRGSQVANLAEVNELIIRRMRTGVLLVDGGGHIGMANEAAMLLLGDACQPGAPLKEVSLPLAQLLATWHRDDVQPPHSLQLAADLPEVQPRFARLLAGGEQTLLFLDDTSLLSRHAESMTLATLGRFSASLAHEIRNPLAAISYATQLLEESLDIPEEDRRLLQIIYQQTHRMNGIISNVLSLARRERAHPEHVELTGLVRRFLQDYAESHPLEDDRLLTNVPGSPVTALCDPGQLQQVLGTLVHNALLYGRQPDQPARVTVTVHQDSGAPTIDVTDRGPGIPEAVASQLFRPFHTTSPHGTGLGLYIARELCRANQASLEYVAVPGGGACFRIQLVGTRAIAVG